MLITDVREQLIAALAIGKAGNGDARVRVQLQEGEHTSWLEGYVASADLTDGEDGTVKIYMPCWIGYDFKREATDDPDYHSTASVAVGQIVSVELAAPKVDA